MNCPKCKGSMSGPRYIKKFKAGLPGTFEESLNYSCSQCGYTESQPCKDSVDESKKYLTEG